MRAYLPGSLRRASFLTSVHFWFEVGSQVPAPSPILGVLCMARYLFGGKTLSTVPQYSSSVHRFLIERLQLPFYLSGSGQPEDSPFLAPVVCARRAHDPHQVRVLRADSPSRNGKGHPSRAKRGCNSSEPFWEGSEASHVALREVMVWGPCFNCPGSHYAWRQIAPWILQLWEP